MRNLPVFPDLRAFLSHFEGQGALARIAEGGMPVTIMTPTDLVSVGIALPQEEYEAHRQGRRNEAIRLSGQFHVHLCQIAETLSEKGVDLVVLDQNIDTSDATGRLLFNMLGAIGQFETEIRAERQMDGIKKAKDRGVQFGKRPALNDDQIADLREKRKQGALIRELMTEYRLSKATIYRYLAENGA